MTRLVDLFLPILTSLAIAVAATPAVILGARRLGLLDVPGTAPHKQHASATPLGGGVVLLLAVLGAHVLLRRALAPHLLGILAGGAFLAVWGLVDDWRGLSPLGKLTGQALAIAVVVSAGVEVRLFQDRFVNLALTLLWCLGLINALNFIDSMDGLALGLAGISAAFFMLVTVDSGQVGLAWLAAAILGATIGLYFYNAVPARIFLGDSGSQLLGLWLAAIGVAYAPRDLPQGVSWFTPILVMGVPIFDMTMVIVGRLRERRPVYQAAMDHTYHRLVALGLDPTRAVLAMQLTAIGLGLLAFLALDLTVLAANLLLAAVVLGGLVVLAALLRLTDGH